MALLLVVLVLQHRTKEMHGAKTRQLYHEVKHKNEKNRRIPNFVSFRDRLGIFPGRKGCYDGLAEASARHAADVFSPEHPGDNISGTVPRL